MIYTQRMRVSVTLIEKYDPLDQQNQSSFNWKFFHIFFKKNWDTIYYFLNQNTSWKYFWKPSVLVWHGQNTNVSQIKKKKVGAWPLWFFLIVAYIIYVSNFSFDISLRKKIFFLWCHTNTHGIDLRRTPHHQDHQYQNFCQCHVCLLMMHTNNHY